MILINPAELGAPSGYSNGALAPAGAKILFVAGQVGWNRDPKLVSVAFLALIACLFYPIAFAIEYYDTGFSLNSRWTVIEVTLCEDHPDYCDEHEAPIQVGDRITVFAGHTFEEFESDRYLGNGDKLRSKEELLYYRIFKGHFGDSVPLNEIGRTQDI